MAIFERNFIGGKMNIDLDDRLIQPGTYRRGQNISVSTSDNSDVGALESIRGNVQILPPPNLQLNTEVFILGSTVDRLKDKVYWYFVGNATEGIYELDVSLGADGEPKNEINRVLEFTVGRGLLNFQVSNLITGSAVVEDLLIWTDGLNPVRKINIDRLRGSGNYYLPSTDRDLEDGSAIYTIRDIISHGSQTFIYSTSLDFTITDVGKPQTITGVLMGRDAVGFTFDPVTRIIRLNSPPDLGPGAEITINYSWVITDASVKSDKATPTTKLISDINPTYDGYDVALASISPGRYNDPPVTDPNDAARGANPPNEQLEFPGDLINLGKRPPLQPPRWMKVETGEKTIHNNNLEENFVYFAYRYVYSDGEVTPLSPFSEPAFFPEKFSINTEQGTLSSFRNAIDELDIFYNTGSEEVVEVEIWLTKGLGRPIQSLISINKANENIPSSAPNAQVERKVRYSNNKTYRTLPQNEANYIFSDIPITAKALEFAGNRLVLGNYTRNYSLTKINEQGTDITPDFKLELDEIRSKKQDPTTRDAAKSLKSDREYEVGIVYLDNEGRQSSVIVSEGNTYSLDWARHQYTNQFQLRINSAAPYWATHYRVFYKSVEGQYNNLYPIKVLPNQTGDRVYLQLAPNDVNKVTSESRLTFKGNSAGVAMIRKEFRVDPYSASVGTDGGLRLERTEEGTFALDSSTASQNFFVPFDVVTEHTGGALTESNNLKDQLITVPLDDTLTQATEFVVNGLSLETITNVVVTSMTVKDGGLIPRTEQRSTGGAPITTTLWAFNSTTKTLTLYAAFFTYVQALDTPAYRAQFLNVDFGALTLLTNFSDSTVENPNEEFAYVALAPLEEGALTRFIDNDGDMHSIWETVDDDIGALEDAVYFEWGQTFRCANGAHTTSQGEVVLIDDKIQVLYEQKATGRTAMAIDGEEDLEVIQLTTDLQDGFYDVSWTDTNDILQLRRNIPFTRSGLNRGNILFPQPETITLVTVIENGVEVLVGRELIITDAIPEFKSVTNALGEIVQIESGLQLGDPILKTETDDSGEVVLPLTYFNCFSYAFGVEEIKIRSLFNSQSMSPGIRASAVNEAYRRRNQISHLIHSGIFNDDVSLNRLNEFNRANNIERELEINSGSIQHLHARDTNLIVFQENKVKNVPINKNLIQSAGGNTQLTTSSEFFGTENAYDGEYGISRNPESFATYGSRMYFADKDRGALLRLSSNGITEISQQGTESFIRDILSKSDLIVCSYDDNRDQAHFSFRRKPQQPIRTNIYQNEFVISQGSCPDPRATCNTVMNWDGDRTVENIKTIRVYSEQENPANIPPLYGLSIGDVLFSDPERTKPVVGHSRFYLLHHAAVDTFPANNIAIQISDNGNIKGLEPNCFRNRPPDLARQRFGISEDTFGSAQDACANGVVEHFAYHNGGERRAPEKGEYIFEGPYDVEPLPITGYRLVIVETEKYVLELDGGLVTDRYDCDILAIGRTPILGSHPILIPFLETPAKRNVTLCEAPWAEEVYWFDAETELPEIGTELYENDHNYQLTYGPWSPDYRYIALTGSGQYVHHNNIIWKKNPNVLSTTLTKDLSYEILSVVSNDWTSVGLQTLPYVGEVFTASIDLDVAALALLGTVTVHAQPSFTNPNWSSESGYIFVTFENGYFCAIGADGKIITYGTCSEVLCFANPNDLIINDDPAKPFDFRFPGITANYTVSTTGTNTELLTQLSPIRGAEINYVTQGATRRYPSSGSLQVNAEDMAGNVFYSPVFDTSAPREIIEGRDLQTLFLNAGDTFVLPQPTEADFALEQSPFVQVTSLCYRGLAFNSTGDPLDIIPNPPTIDSILVSPISRVAEVTNEITLTGIASDSDGTIIAYQWNSVDALGNSVDIDSNLTVSSGSTSSSMIGVTAATATGPYVLRLTVTDSNIIKVSQDVTINFVPEGVEPPVVTIFADGTDYGTATYSVVREVDVVLTATAVPVDSSNTVNSWTWTLPDDVALVSGDLTGTSSTVGSITVGSNSARLNQSISLSVADDGGGVGVNNVTITWTAQPDDGRRILKVFLSNTALSTDVNIFDSCGQVLNNTVYYDFNVLPVKYYISSSLLDTQVFDGGGGNWGASIDVELTEAEGGSVGTRVQTIGSDGVLADEVPRLCAAPYAVDLGYTFIGNNTTYPIACQNLNTPAFIDQPIRNFGGVSEQDDADVIYTRKADGTISFGPDGYWTDGKIIIPSLNGVLGNNQEAVLYGCDRARTFTLEATKSASSNANVGFTYTPTDGDDVKNVGEAFSVTATIVGTNNYNITGTPSWSATNGGQPAENGTGRTYEFKGIAGATNQTRDVSFTATAEAGGPTTYQAQLTGALNTSDPSPGSFTYSHGSSGTTTTETGIAANGAWNVYICRYAGAGKRWSTYPSVTASGSAFSTGTTSSDAQYYCFTDSGTNIGTTNRATTVTFKGGAVEDIPTEYTTRLTGTIKDIDNAYVDFDGGTTTTSTYTQATGEENVGFSLSATLTANTDWIVSSVDQTNPTLHAGSFSSSVSNESVEFTGSTSRPSFTSLAEGSTALLACSGGGGTVYGIVGGNIWDGSTSTTKRGKFYYQHGTTIYYWNGTSNGTSTTVAAACPIPDNVKVELGFNSSSSGSACTATASSYYTPPGTTFTTATKLYTGLTGTTDAANGFYVASGTTIRQYTNGAFTSTTTSTCPVTTGTISLDKTALTIMNSNQSFAGITVTVTPSDNTWNVTGNSSNPSGWSIRTDNNQALPSTGSLGGSYRVYYPSLPNDVTSQIAIFIFTDKLSKTSTTLTVTRLSSSP